MIVKTSIAVHCIVISFFKFWGHASKKCFLKRNEIKNSCSQMTSVIVLFCCCCYKLNSFEMDSKILFISFRPSQFLFLVHISFFWPMFGWMCAWLQFIMTSSAGLSHRHTHGTASITSRQAQRWLKRWCLLVFYQFSSLCKH